jgi:hypothetical protein
VVADIDLGVVLNCSVTAYNDGGTSPAPAAAQMIYIGPPINTVPPVIAGSATEGQLLNVSSTGTWSTGTAPVTSQTYQWQRNGVDIPGAGGLTTTSYTTVAADLGAMITCVVTRTTPGGSGSGASNAIGPIVGVPVNITPPVMTGNSGGGAIGIVGDVLLTSEGTWTNNPTGSLIRTTRNGTIIQNNGNYQTVAADNGALMWGSVYTANAAGNSLAVSSNIIAMGPPFNSGAAPIIAGSAVQGQGVISLNNNGVWSCGTLGTITRQWQRNGVDIAGATAISYATVAADLGAMITCFLTNTTAGGSGTATSNAIGPITASGTEEDPDFVAPMPSRAVHRAKPKKKR